MGNYCCFVLLSSRLHYKNKVILYNSKYCILYCLFSNSIKKDKIYLLFLFIRETRYLNNLDKFQKLDKLHIVYLIFWGWEIIAQKFHFNFWKFLSYFYISINIFYSFHFIFQNLHYILIFHTKSNTQCVVYLVFAIYLVSLLNKLSVKI